MTEKIDKEREDRVNEIREGLSLSYANIFETPVSPFDWSQEYPGERWDIIEPDFGDDDDTRKFLEYAGVEIDEREDTETDEEYEERLVEAAQEAWREGEYGVPMMNYYYPIELRYGASPAELQMRLMLDGGAVTLVEVDANPVLALTGGGMDLSWDVCLAYIICGSYPPLHFCDLPDFAGQKASDKNLQIVAACLETCAAAAHRAERAAIRLGNIAKNLTEPNNATA